jgi:hypothetical protein
MNFHIHPTTLRRRVHTCVHDLRTLGSPTHYQLNSFLSSIYLGYWPKTCSKRPSQRFVLGSNGLTPARNLTATTDQFGRAQVWHTVGKQTGPGANVVKASHPALDEDITCTSARLLAPA